MESQGLRLEALRGEAIPDSYFPLMYDYYEGTNAQFGPWAAKYLTKDFFLEIAEAYRHRLLFIAANAGNGEPVAMSLLLVKGDCLLGRYWGGRGDYDSLHFNACYYKPIEWAISHGIRRFDPGAGSSHKIRRGFHAIANHSYHRFIDERLNKIMEMHIEEINEMEESRIDSLNERLPFAQDSN